jgi:hypothetical protein
MFRMNLLLPFSVQKPAYSSTPKMELASNYRNRLFVRIIQLSEKKIPVTGRGGP